MNQSKMSIVTEKKFVIKHVFRNVLDFGRSGGLIRGNEIDFYNKWNIILKWIYPSFQIRLISSNACKTDKWTIYTKIDILFNGKAMWDTQNHTFSNTETEKVLLLFEADCMNYHLVDGNLKVEIHVTILKMTGIKSKNSRRFDESAKKFSDVVLKVMDQKFYVSKLFLAAQSSYFEALLLGKFEESGKTEVQLKDIDPEDFQNFLEAIYGETVIDEKTVEGILHLADMYDAKSVVNRCEEFFLYRSQQSMKDKFHAGVKYRMKKLKEKCLSELKTIDDYKSILPEDNKQFDSDVWGDLCRKIIALK